MKDFFWDSSKPVNMEDVLRSIATGWKAQNQALDGHNEKEALPCS